MALKGKDHVTLSLTHYIFTIRHAHRCPTKIGQCGNDKGPFLFHKSIMSILIAVLVWTQNLLIRPTVLASALISLNGLCRSNCTHNHLEKS